MTYRGMVAWWMMMDLTMSGSAISTTNLVLVHDEQSIISWLIKSTMAPFDGEPDPFMPLTESAVTLGVW